jgi:hypothetical protein
MLRRSALFLFSLLLTIGVSQGGIITAVTSLSAANEIPTNSSTATGSAIVTIDTVLNTLRVQVAYINLSSTITGAHIHCCIAQPANTGVATTLPVFPGFPSALSGTYDNTLDLTSAASYNPSFVTAQGGLPQAEAAFINGITNGQTYLNIHTSNNPSGEIRGILTVTPEPGTTLLMTAGMGAMLLAWRRRRRA